MVNRQKLITSQKIHVKTTHVKVFPELNTEIYYYSSVKRNEILSFVTTLLGLEGIMFSQVSQAEKDKHMISLTYGT